MTPELPTETIGGKTFLAPGRVYDGQGNEKDTQRHSCESPTFYAIFPFRLFGVDKPKLVLAIDSYRRALDVAHAFQPFTLGNTPLSPSYSGWQQVGPVAALLGLTDDAKTVLVNNSALNNPGNRFPAMWGPTYDAVPDSDHAANLLTTLQLMAFQTDGDKILVLPAWPKKWNVSFKFRAPKNTTVELVYRDGKVEKLEVIPAARSKDVLLMCGP